MSETSAIQWLIDNPSEATTTTEAAAAPETAAPVTMETLVLDDVAKEKSAEESKQVESVFSLSCLEGYSCANTSVELPKWPAGHRCLLQPVVPIFGLGPLGCPSDTSLCDSV